MFAIEFDKQEWESSLAGARFKAFRRDAKQLRLVEFTLLAPARLCKLTVNAK